MKVILIEEDAFFELIDRVVERMSEKLSKKENKWLTPEEAMKELGVKSTSTLQRYRDEGKIRYSQPSKKIILYDPSSIQEFLESKANDTF
ncbi:MAG: helix-turn-helix domain-containing protein [Roseivirga sp.]|uniref:helix-turn-helix domain-containing protein n=1 Tax=Roseivirga sp. TaxID=1964215 RepID=UPI001B0FF995|nr:helix-turn-helix domain-containing protein [Roseivirga sp.]MBO6662702.1 helix-turn-helix domain-containing protein [Roseivirga sp.]MBO6909709.1 helix-turn-helix domain-containing protein [Roseivirga sp.]